MIAFGILAAMAWVGVALVAIAGGLGLAVCPSGAEAHLVAQGTSVTEEYKEREKRFTGKIHKVTVEVRSCVEERNGASLLA